MLVLHFSRTSVDFSLKNLKTPYNDAVDSRTTYVIHFLDDVLKTSVNTGLIYKCLHFKTLMGMDYLKTS